MNWWSRCTPKSGRCEGCDGEASDAIDEALGDEAESAIGWAGRKSKKLIDGSRAVNMRNLGRHFVERVLDVRRTPTTDQSAGREGETLQFLAQVRGWQGVQAAARKERLLRLNDWSLGHQLTQAAGTDIFFIPQEHYPRAEPENGESGWWYRVREVAQCRQCMVCCRRKLRAEFTGEGWNKQRPVKCSQCKGDGQRSASRGQNRRKHKRARRDSQGGCDEGCDQSMVQDGEEADSGEPTEERRSSRRRNLLRENLGDRQDSGSEADLQDEERDVHQVQMCALMSPANPRYVGRGDDSRGGEVTYTMQEMRTLLLSLIHI